MTETDNCSNPEVMLEYRIESLDRSMVMPIDPNQEFADSCFHREYPDRSPGSLNFYDFFKERIEILEPDAVYINSLEYFEDENGEIPSESKETVEELLPGEQDLETDKIYGEPTDERFERYLEPDV